MNKTKTMKTYKKKGARGDRRRPHGRGGGEGGSTEARYITK